MTVGEKIKYYRKLYNITQNQLADVTGIHIVSIAKYETNKMQPQPAQLKRITDALGIHPYALIDLEFKDEIADRSDAIGLILQFCKNKIMAFEGERRADGSLDPETAHLVFDSYFMSLFAASSFGTGEHYYHCYPPFKEDEFNANKLLLRPINASLEEGLLRWEQANYLYTQAKYAYKRDGSIENLEIMNDYLDKRDLIELDLFRASRLAP